MGVTRAFLWGSNGNGRYSPLRFAKEDASALASVLRQPRYAFDAEVHEDTSDPFKVFAALKKAAAACRNDDIFLAHFSGHGQISGSRLYLVHDASDPDDVSTLFSSMWLIEAFSECRARNKLLILDCCHAGAATGVKGQGAPVAELLPELAANQRILYASGKLEEARELEELGGSFVTRTLCRILEAEQSGPVMLSQVTTALQVAADQYNRAQQSAARRVPIPFLSGLQQGEFYFTRTPGAATSSPVSSDVFGARQVPAMAEALSDIRRRMLAAGGPWELARLHDEVQAIISRLEREAAPAGHIAEARELSRRLVGSLPPIAVTGAGPPLGVATSNSARRRMAGRRMAGVAAAGLSIAVVLLLFLFLPRAPGGLAPDGADAGLAADASIPDAAADTSIPDAARLDAPRQDPRIPQIAFPIDGCTSAQFRVVQLAGRVLVKATCTCMDGHQTHEFEIAQLTGADVLSRDTLQRQFERRCGAD